MVTTNKLATRARAEGVVITVVALGYLWQTQKIPALYQMPGVPGPAAFPTVLGVALALAGLSRLILGGPAEEQDRDEETPEPEGEVAAAPAAPAGAIGAWLAEHGKFAGLWAVLVAYFAFMPELGFPLGSALALGAMGRLLGERRWYVYGLGAVVVTAVLHLAFAYGLGVRLPLGVLSFLGK